MNFRTYLMANLNNGFDAIVALEETFLEVVRFSWNPDRLLGIVGTQLVLTLHLHGQELFNGKKNC